MGFNIPMAKFTIPGFEGTLTILADLSVALLSFLNSWIQ